MNNNAERLLMIVDMVNGFVSEGPMADNYIAHIIPEIENLAEQYEKDEIIIIKDCHNEDSVEFKAFPKHCLKGTNEAELVNELKRFENGATVLEKNSTSAIFAEGFMDKIKELKNLKEIVITGCCTDICVLNLAVPLKNYFNQENREVEIIVPKNAVETYNSDIHSRDEYNEIAFKILKMTGITVK